MLQHARQKIPLDTSRGCDHDHTEMRKPIDKRTRSLREWWDGQHRHEHWLVDNQVYFITSRCRDRVPAFAGAEAKSIFWDRFTHYTSEFSFVPWVTSLLDNHYHTLGYLKVGANLPTMIQRIHGSVAKLVNDTLEARLTPFWRTRTGHEYFDGCIRDEVQARRAYRYTLIQAQRHSVVDDYRSYPHTRVNLEVDRAIARVARVERFPGGRPLQAVRRSQANRRACFSTRGTPRMMERRGSAGRGVDDVRRGRPAC